MGIFDRFRSTGQVAANSSMSKASTPEQDVARLIKEGHVLEADGQLDEAMQRYLGAIHIAPDPARAYLNLGNVLLLKGNLQNALDAFRTAIKHKPDYAGAYYNIGNALLGNKQFDEAAASYRQALKVDPDYPEAHCALGITLKGLGQLDDALVCFQKALAINPDLVEARLNVGNALQNFYNKAIVLMGNGELIGAIANFRLALEIEPNLAEAHGNLGVALHDLGQFEDALTSYHQALKIKPEYSEAHNNLGIALQDLGLFENAVASCRRALEIKPDFAEAHNNLGNALQNLGQFENAAASCHRALEIKPDYAEAHSNLGNALKELGQFENAESSYRRALEIKSDLIETRLNLGFLLLSQGRYHEAWPEYESRYNQNLSGRSALPKLPFPKWQGEPLTGKSIVIWPEQGFGDEIQFARYCSLLKSQGASRLTLVCKPPLKILLKTLSGVDVVISESDAASLPPHDYWSLSLSLPLHFATTIETIPAKLPYLCAPADRLNRWSNQLPSGELRVGLVWKGYALHKNDSNRSLPSLSTLAPLWSVPGVTFISLQKGQGEEETATPLFGQPILHLGTDITDFADTAAIVSQLDLVICIDTAIAHLAGALNKTCWVLLPAIDTDWRWLRERADSPWYPGVMRLFRQTKAGDWDQTIDGVARTLKTWVDERSITIQNP